MRETFHTVVFKGTVQKHETYASGFRYFAPKPKILEDF